jgi:hypothetical protein
MVNNNSSSNNLPCEEFFSEYIFEAVFLIMSRSSNGMIVACVSCHVQKEKSNIRDVKHYSSLRFEAKLRGSNML